MGPAFADRFQRVHVFVKMALGDSEPFPGLLGEKLLNPLAKALVAEMNGDPEEAGRQLGSACAFDSHLRPPSPAPPPQWPGVEQLLANKALCEKLEVTDADRALLRSTNTWPKGPKDSGEAMLLLGILQDGAVVCSGAR